MKKINKLTKEQEAQMAPYAQKWIDIGLKTGEADWETFDTYMPIAYAKAGLMYPKNVVRVQSPLIGALAASLAEGILRKKRSAVGGAVHGAVSDAVGGAVRGAVGDAVRDAVGGAVGGAVPQSATAMEKSGIEFAIGLKDKLGVNIERHYWLGGQFWVGYWWRGVSFVNFFFDVCGLELPKDIMERAEANRKIYESVNYIWPNRDFIIVCDRPKEIHRNAEGRLHSTKGMAIRYGDGWGLYFIHGVKFTEEQFLKVKDASITDIIAWEDIDQRSALLRERPIKELLENVKKTLVDHTDECGGYDLYELELEGLRNTKVLAYSGWSSDKEYIKFVPPTSKKALETVAELRHQTVEELLNATNS